MEQPEPIDSRELSLLSDREPLLTKKSIDQKLTSLLLQGQEKIIEHCTVNNLQLPDAISLHPRKIAKGENYQDMPYWVSDFPASLHKAHIWAFRTVVWWGHCFSFSLILKGKFKTDWPLDIRRLQDQDIYYTLHSDPWKIEFTPEVQTKVYSASVEKVDQHYIRHDFLKLSIMHDLEQINSLPAFSLASFEKIIGLFQKLA